MHATGYAQHFRDEKQSIRAFRDKGLYAVYSYLIDDAEYQSHGVTFNGEAVTLEQGDVRTRIRKIAYDLGMAVATVRQKLHLLVMLGKITYQTAWDGIIVKIAHLAARLGVRRFLDTSRRTPRSNRDGYNEEVPRRNLFKSEIRAPKIPDWKPEVVEVAHAIPSACREEIRKRLGIW